MAADLKAPNMNAILPAHMLEATRLTREGRLTEASALLQRALGGKPMPDAAPNVPKAGDYAGSARAPRLIDIDPETGDALHPAPAETHHRPDTLRTDAFGEDVASRMPASLRGFLGQVPMGGSAPSLRHHARGTTPPRTEPLPVGARFDARTYSGPAGHRDYKLYIPSGHRGTPVPLLVMLHGCTQSPDDFAAGTRMNALAEEHGCLVVYPEQSKAANAQKCWNWFSPGDQRRDRGEPAIITGITNQVLREHRVDAGRIYIAGLSAGGAAAAIMAQAYPDVYAAVGIHSGLPCGAASDLPTAFAAMQRGAVAAPRHGGAADGGRLNVPTIVFHADRDTTVHPRNGDLVVAQVGEMGVTMIETHTGQVPSGHAYKRTLHLTATGETVLEQWLVHGAGHAWSGGSSLGSYTDPRGPDASREMLRFFLQHSRKG